MTWEILMGESMAIDMLKRLGLFLRRAWTGLSYHVTTIMRRNLGIPIWKF